MSILPSTPRSESYGRSVFTHTCIYESEWGSSCISANFIAWNTLKMGSFSCIMNFKCDYVRLACRSDFVFKGLLPCSLHGVCLKCFRALCNSVKCGLINSKSLLLISSLISLKNYKKSFDMNNCDYLMFLLWYDYVVPTTHIFIIINLYSQ